MDKEKTETAIGMIATVTLVGYSLTFIRFRASKEQCLVIGLIAWQRLCTRQTAKAWIASGGYADYADQLKTDQYFEKSQKRFQNNH